MGNPGIVADLKLASLKAEFQGTGSEKVWKVEDRPELGYLFLRRAGRGG